MPKFLHLVHTGVSEKKAHTIEGTIVGSPIFRKPPFIRIHIKHRNTTGVSENEDPTIEGTIAGSPLFGNPHTL